MDQTGLLQFESDLARLIGRPSAQRPFVCSGSPLACRVFIVGFNPATSSKSDFWSFWRADWGFDKQAWSAHYRAERAAMPLRPGRKRRQAISNTRRVIEHIIQAAQPVPCLETNIYAVASVDKASLAIRDRSLEPFMFLLDRIKPMLILTHGRDAESAIGQIAPTVKTLSVSHFSRGWSKDGAQKLGERILAGVRSAEAFGFGKMGHTQSLS